MISVDRPNELQDPKDQLTTIQKGLLTIERGANATGCQLLLPTKLVKGTISAAAPSVFTKIPGFDFAFNASGGVIHISVNLDLTTTNLVSAIAIVALFVDGKQTVTKSIQNPASGLTANVNLDYKVVLPEGNHVIEARWLGSNTSTLILNNDTRATSDMTVCEYSAP